MVYLVFDNIMGTDNTVPFPVKKMKHQKLAVFPTTLQQDR